MPELSMANITMNRKTLNLISLVSLPLLLVIGIRCQQSSMLEKIGEPQIKIIKLSEKENKPLYFVKKNWGYTGDHQLIALTSKKPTDEHWIANKSTDYVWEGEILIYYQQNDDTLKVWSNYLPDTTKKSSINQAIQFEQIKGPMFDKLKQRVDTTIKVID